MFRTRRFITQLINIVFTVVEILLLFRFTLKLLSANQEAAFVRWIYETSQPLLAPFENIFPTVVESGVVIEMSTLFAIMVYAIVSYLLIMLIESVYQASR
jgi:uncharacterized protein YggT (Ycf19 family)